MTTLRDLPVAPNSTLPVPPFQKLITAKEIATLLGMSLRWLHERTRRGEIPFHRFGRRALRFDPDEVRRWLMENRAADPNGGR